MAELTERQILDCLHSNLKEGASIARELAAGKRGDRYPRFRENLNLVYGCCRQIAGWREDTRWGPLGLMVHEARERCRRWLAWKYGPPAFRKLADNLDAMIVLAKNLETKRTGKVGMILPEMLTPDSRTQGRPVSVILPPGFKRAETAH
jgi:hypothetical protein